MWRDGSKCGEGGEGIPRTHWSYGLDAARTTFGKAAIARSTCSSSMAAEVALPESVTDSRSSGRPCAWWSYRCVKRITTVTLTSATRAPSSRRALRESAAGRSSHGRRGLRVEAAAGMAYT